MSIKFGKNNNLFYKTPSQKMIGILLKILDTLYMFGVRLLYHGKLLFLLGVFLSTIIFVTFGFAYVKIVRPVFASTSALASTSAVAFSRSGFYAIDVGQGDSLLFISKQKQTVLIDTGKVGSRIVESLHKILGDDVRKIDIVILTHPDADHDGEIMNVINSFNVGLVLYSPIYLLRTDGVKTVSNIRRKLGEKNLSLSSEKVLPIFAGANLVFSASPIESVDSLESLTFITPAVFSSAQASALASLPASVSASSPALVSAPLSASTSSPDNLFTKKEIDDNNFFSVSLIIEVSSSSVFAMADVPQKMEKVFLNILGALSLDALKLKPSRILKAGHHGSKTSSAEEFVKNINPTDVIFSYGKNNRYKHPSKETEELFIQFMQNFPKTKIHRTTEGAVYFGE